MLRNTRIRAAALALATATLLSSCATTGSGQYAGGAQQADRCNPWAAGAVGALLGAAVGARRDSDAAAKGAIAGAAVGALGCIAINASSKRVQSADTVREEYARANGGALPVAPEVLTYQTQILPGQTVSAGQPIEVSSNLKLLEGTARKIESVREDIVLVDTSGKEFRRFPKEVIAGEGGTYHNTFEFAFPRGVTQGYYGVRTELFVNGEEVRQTQERLQLVMVEQGGYPPLARR